jgi:hypothetical protein
VSWQAHTIFRDLTLGAVFVFVEQKEGGEGRFRQPAAGEDVEIVRPDRAQISAVVVASTPGELTIELASGHRALLTPRETRDGPSGYRPHAFGYTEWTAREVIAPISP